MAAPYDVVIAQILVLCIVTIFPLQKHFTIARYLETKIKVKMYFNKQV